METVQAISLMLGAGWASGINLYAAVLVLGWLGSSGQVDLPAGLSIVSEPSVMLAAGFMYMVEFFTDKIPGVDSVWDLLHTFIRIPAGALLAAGAAQGLDIGPAAEMVGLITGGSLAAASHATKAGSRALINTSPEPVSNWSASVGEDVAVVGGLWTALNYPWLFIILLILFLALAIWLLPKIWRALKAIFGRIRNWFGRDKAPPANESAAEPADQQSTSITNHSPPRGD